MPTFAPLPELDLSLNISPPFILDSEAKEVRSYNGSDYSASTSSSTGSDLSHENDFFHHNLGHLEPTLSLGFENVENLNPHRVQGLSRNFNHHLHNYQPHIYGRDFKRNCSTRAIRDTVKRSIIRAPRMRWTTTLHAHFVHAVQLLGGHESKDSI